MIRVKVKLASPKLYNNGDGFHKTLPIGTKVKVVDIGKGDSYYPLKHLFISAELEIMHAQQGFFKFPSAEEHKEFVKAYERITGQGHSNRFYFLDMSYLYPFNSNDDKN